MKKLFYICMVACLAVFGFSSCGPEGMVDNTPVTGHPEELAAGVYVGTWTRILNADTLVAEGKVVVTPDTAYVVSIDVDAVSSISLKQMTTLANVAQDSHYGTKIFNSSASNGFGTGFRGATFEKDGVQNLTLNFVLTVQEPRKPKKDFKFSYVGLKQIEE